MKFRVLTWFSLFLLVLFQQFRVPQLIALLNPPKRVIPNRSALFAECEESPVLLNFVVPLQSLRVLVPHIMFRDVGFFTWLEQFPSRAFFARARAPGCSAGAPYAGFSVWDARSKIQAVSADR